MTNFAAQNCSLHNEFFPELEETDQTDKAQL